MHGRERIDPLDELGNRTDGPLPHWVWGNIPDQYGRSWDDDGEPPPTEAPKLTDLLPLLSWWGPQTRADRS